MWVIDPGHHYGLGVFDDTGEFMIQNLRFMKRVGKGYPGNRKPTYPGTNCQEVLRALIDRVKYLDRQIPHPQNEIILIGLRGALEAFEIRASERHGRIFQDSDQNIEDREPCYQCGHITCKHMEEAGYSVRQGEF